MSCRRSAPVPPLPEPLLQLPLAGFGTHPPDHHHGVVGGGGSTQIKAAAQGPPFGVRRSEDHPAHPRLHKGAGTHGAGFQGDKQSVAVEAPVPAQAGGLGQRQQFGMTQRISVALAAIVAPADGSAEGVKHHCRHRDLPQGTCRGGPPQQPLHPPLVVTSREGGQ